MGWYHRGLYNGYIQAVDQKGQSTGVQNTNTKNEVSAKRSAKVDFASYMASD